MKFFNSSDLQESMGSHATRCSNSGTAVRAADRKNSMDRISNIYFHPMRARIIFGRTRCARRACDQPRISRPSRDDKFDVHRRWRVNNAV
jgi:hypothetical protein